MSPPPSEVPLLGALCVAPIWALRIFATLAPRRLHVLIDKAKPLERHERRLPAGMETTLVLIGITIAVSATFGRDQL